MDYKSERRRDGVSVYREMTRNIPGNKWWELVEGLNDDETIVAPHVYKRMRHLFDSVIGRVYILKGPGDEGRIDWVWESRLSSVTSRGDVDIIAEWYLVRYRLPWYQANERFEWFISQAELDERREDLQVLEVYIRAIDKTTGILDLINPLWYEEHPENYEIVETRYLVCWRSSEDPGIDPALVHTQLGE